MAGVAVWLGGAALLLAWLLARILALLTWLLVLARLLMILSTHGSNVSVFVEHIFSSPNKKAPCGCIPYRKRR